MRISDPVPLAGQTWQLPSGEIWSEQYFESFLTIDPVAMTALPTPTVAVTATQVYDGASLAVAFNASRGVYHVDINDLKPVDSTGAYVDDSNDAMERVDLTINNPSSEEQVVTLLFEKSRSSGLLQKIGFPITGVSAILRDTNGAPLGVPVQLSKNWHNDPNAGIYNHLYFHGYSVVRLAPGETVNAELSIVYGHYGGVAAASHSQLSVIGYRKNQQWDETAMGAWGESICYDAEGVFGSSAITDVRPLMVTGLDANLPTFAWTHNVGGADFMRLFDAAGLRVPVKSMRTAYEKYGPCLTDVTYSGFVGSAMKHSVATSISRSDDIVRGTYRVRMDVLEAVSFSRFVVFGIGTDTYSKTGEVKMAHGNINGMVSEWNTQWGGDTYRTSMEAAGSTPWISLHEAVARDPTGAWANRGIVIRSWDAVVGGQSVSPWFAEYGADVSSVATSTADVVLPPSVTSLAVGDYVEAVFELVVLPQFSGDYYGPNVDLNNALVADADTWELMLREVTENDRTVTMVTGTLQGLHPAVTVATSSVQGGTAELVLDGGIGYVPVTFTGLAFSSGYTVEVDGVVVDQSEIGNDFWQTDYDAESQTWSQTYNLPRSDAAASVTIKLVSSHP